MTEDQRLSNAYSRLQKIRNDSKKRLYQYVAPKWADDLRWIPRMKIDLFQKSTPIHRWHLPGIPAEFEIFIKRDDLTGGAISGHKIRRMEFILADALEKNCDTVIACGKLPSNNCRTLAVSGKEIGFHVHLCLHQLPGKGYVPLTVEKLPFHGNNFIEKVVGAYLHHSKEPNMATAKELQIELNKKLCLEGYSPYLFPPGGPGDVSLFGYIDCFDELLAQGVTESFSDLVITCATGLTAAGFIIGNYRNGGKLRIHAFSIEHNEARIRNQIIALLKDVGFLKPDYSEDNFSDLIHIFADSLLPGAGIFTEEHIEFVNATAKETAILLDPVYTGKSAYHMVRKIQMSPEMFQGRKILFFNTGSVFGMMRESFC